MSEGIWTKFASGTVIVAIAAGLFGGGAAYQRFGSMETHLISIDAQMTRIADVQNQLIMLQDAQREHERRIAVLEAAIKQLR